MTKLKELIGDSHHLDYDVNYMPAPFLTANETGGRVVFVDDMGFHRDHYAEELCELGMYDENGEWLGLDGAGCIMERIIEREAGLPKGSVSVDADGGGDEVALEYTYELPDEALDMDVDSEELFDLCWDFLAACVNVTDPGTFGSPYIITEAARSLV